MEELIPWAVGVIGVPVVGWLKGRLGWNGKQALWLTAGVSVCLAIGVLIYSGDLTTAEISWANVAGVFGVVFSAATLVYKQFAKKKE